MLGAIQVPHALQQWVTGAPAAETVHLPDGGGQGGLNTPRGLWQRIVGGSSPSSSPVSDTLPAGRRTFVAASHSPGWSVQLQLPPRSLRGEGGVDLPSAADSEEVTRQVATSKAAARAALGQIPFEARTQLASTLRDGIAVVERHQQEQLLVMSVLALATLALGRQVHSMRTAGEVGLPNSAPRGGSASTGGGARQAPSHIPRAARAATGQGIKLPFAFKAIDKSGARVTVVGPWTRRGGHVAVAALACGMVGCGLEWARLQIHDRALMLRTVRVLDNEGGRVE